MSGPAPLPTALKALRGTTRRDRANPDEPKPTGEVGVPPSRLDRDQKRAWRDVAGAAWWGTESDRPALELLACALGDARRLRRELKDEPAVIKGSRGEVRNPKTYLLREAEDRATKLLGEFGLTPSSRSRVSVERPSEEPVITIRPRIR